MQPFAKRNTAAMYVIAAATFMFCCAQPSHCLWLRKAARGGGGEQPGEAAVQATETREGRIVFGRVFERDGVVKSRDVGGARPSHAGGDTTFQGDQPGHERDASARLAREAWGNMFPNLQCTKDSIKFRAVGSGAPHVLIDRENGSPLPIFQVPSSCGYTVHRNALLLVMSVPYHGCYVDQEGESYVLPLHWLGTPVSLLCPKLNPPQESSTAVPSTTTKPPPRQPEIPQKSNRPYRGVPASNHYSPPVTAAPLKAKMPNVPNPFFLTNTFGNAAFPQPYPYYVQQHQGSPLLPAPTTAAPVATTTPPDDPTQPPPADPVPQLYQFPIPPYPNFYPWLIPNPQSAGQFPFYSRYPIPMPSYNYNPAAQPQVSSQTPPATVKEEGGAVAPSSYAMHPNWQLFQMPGQSPGTYVEYQQNVFPENSGLQGK